MQWYHTYCMLPPLQPLFGLVTQHPLFPFERERALCDETKYWLEKRENPNPPTERKSKLFVYS